MSVNASETEVYGICGQSEKGRCSAERGREASGNGTGIKCGNLHGRERMDDDLDPETETGRGERGPRARRGRLIRRVRQLTKSITVGEGGV